MKNLYLFIFLFFVGNITAQTALTIPVIQGSGSSSAYSGSSIRTSGIVTAKYIGSGMINGFFMQDPTGDANPNTSDGIFVSTSTDNVSVGDKIQLTATVNEYSGRTQLTNPTNMTIVSRNNPLPVVKIIYDIYNYNLEEYEGMLVEFNQTLWVNNNSRLEAYGELELGVKRKPSPTNVAFPASSAYQALVSENSLQPLYMDDARTSNYVSPIVLADANGTRRTGERVTNFQAIVDYTSGKFVIYPVQFPVPFYGNPRKAAPDEAGNYNLKVCAFNLEYYLTQSFGTGYGPNDQVEANKQHTKIVEALKAIDADIYGLIEIEQGQAALAKLANALNNIAGGSKYNYVNDGGTASGSYTKVGYLYRSDRVSPYNNSLVNINSPSPANRKKIQAFQLNENNERFSFSLNHLKAKSGCPSSGEDADQGDGQSCFNATRTAEANAVISAINTNKASKFKDEDVLVMGDMNAYAFEDPIQAFVKAGYKDMHRELHGDSAYSYVYRGEAGYLDHALATPSLAKQITFVSAFHINADEPAMFEYSGSNYQGNMYRCSDHDPVVVGIALSGSSDIDTVPSGKNVKIYPTLVTNTFTVKGAENFYIQIFSVNGVKIYENQVASSVAEYDVRTLGLSAGAYVVRVLGNGTIGRQMIIVL